MKLELDFLKQQPEFSTRAILTIEALAPLSMVAKMPGKYYRSQPEPTEAMILGLFENALGWHVATNKEDVKRRDVLLSALGRIHGRVPSYTGVGFGSLLQWHIRFDRKCIPAVMHYGDLWSQHLRGASFVGGSRNHDRRAIPIMNAISGGQVTAGDTADAKRDENLIDDFTSGDKVNLTVLRPYFPQYYVSPTPREYIVPEGAYKYCISTTPALADKISAAVSDPAAPLYLGSNDGWVEVSWEVQA
jgi:CRISPR-associated protein Cas5